MDLHRLGGWVVFVGLVVGGFVPGAAAQGVAGRGFAFPGTPDAEPYREVDLPRLDAPGERLAGRYVRVLNDLLVPDSLRTGLDPGYDLADPRVPTPAAGAPGDFRYAPASAASARCEVRRAFLAGDGRTLDCSHFDDVHVYHHLDAFAHGFWRGRLGYDPPFQAVVVTHVAGGRGLARPGDDAILLGDGNLYMRDLARERDLVLHEYVHLVAARLGLAVDRNSPEEAWALSEGFADYFAASYTGSPRLGAWAVTCPPRGECSGPPDDEELRTLATDPAVWNWRGGRPDPDLRYGVCTRYHTGDRKCKTTWHNVTPPYTWGMIWGGTLWDLREAAGAGAADRIAFAALRRVASPRATLGEAARALVAAEADLYGGAYAAAVAGVLQARGFGAGVDVVAEREGEASGLGLWTYPNPARGAATVSFALPAPAAVTVDVVDVLGRRVVRLAEGPHGAGPHAVTWPADVAPGVYLVRLRVERAVRTAAVVVR